MWEIWIWWPASRTDQVGQWCHRKGVLQIVQPDSGQWWMAWRLETISVRCKVKVTRITARLHWLLMSARSYWEYYWSEWSSLQKSRWQTSKWVFVKEKVSLALALDPQEWERTSPVQSSLVCLKLIRHKEGGIIIIGKISETIVSNSNAHHLRC